MGFYFLRSFGWFVYSYSLFISLTTCNPCAFYAQAFAVPFNPIPHSKPLDAALKYTASQIDVLEGLEAVRKRPGMYIGSTDNIGLHHLIWEILDNAVDEALAGFCDTIRFSLNNGNSITITDNGRGIPCDYHASTARSALETVLTVLHSGGKFHDEGTSGAYHVSGGLHGVGLSVVNALSQTLSVKVLRNNSVYSISFAKGKLLTSLQKTVFHEKEYPEFQGFRSGTSVTFLPDETIFKNNANFDYKTIYERLEEVSFLNPGLKFYLKQSDNVKKNTSNTMAIKSDSILISHDGGLSEYVNKLSEGKKALHKIPVICMQGSRNGVFVDAVLRWNKDAFDQKFIGYVNNVQTKHGGTHIEGIKSGITKIMNNFAKSVKRSKASISSILGDFFREGLTAIVSIRMPNPEFEGQTKGRLGNVEVRNMVEQIVIKKFNEIATRDPSILNVILEKALNAKAASDAARAAKEVIRHRSSIMISSLPGKLADCTSSNTSISEIFLVEGDSAAGSAKQGRDRRFQAVLPLRGKILNVEKMSSLQKMYENSELKSLITAIGLQVQKTKADTHTAPLRYNRIIIMTDADVDGAHIRCLLLTFLYRQHREIINNGHVYIACPPLYRVMLTSKKSDILSAFGQSRLKKSNSNELYAWSNDELKNLLGQNSGNAQNYVTTGNYNLQRFKGLGEMMPEQLWSTTMNPETRVLKRVVIDSARKVDRLVSLTMGNCVTDRRKYIVNANLFDSDFSVV